MTLHLPAATAMALAVALNDPRYGLALKRNAAMDAIEELINFLDDTDGDPDFEPSLGFSGYQAESGEVDLEGDDCDFEDGGDDEECDPLEPMLGRPDHLIDQDQSLNGWTSSDECEQTDEDGGNVTDEPHDEEQDCGAEEMTSYKGHRDRPAASSLVARALRMQRGGAVNAPRRDPDEVTEIRPGLVRVGAW